METQQKAGGEKAPAEATALPIIVKSKPLPAIPLVLVDQAFSGHLAKIGREIESLRIATAQDAQSAGGLLTEVTSLERQLEKARKEAKQPFLDMGRNIDAAAQNPATALMSMKTAVKSRMAAWDAGQRRIAAEAERARLEEIARLEAEKRRQEDEARRKADDMAKALAAHGVKISEVELDFEDCADAPKSEIDRRIEAVKFAPSVVPAAAPAGISYRTYLRFAVTDIGKLPEQFVTRSANERAIREAFVTGYKDGDPVPSVPGVAFTIDRVPVSTGRGNPLF